MIDNLDKPICTDNIFWSLSHKENIIYIAISDKNIGVDIEILKQRDISVLDLFSDREYSLF
jgi:phosphopantetheinyl transferase